MGANFLIDLNAEIRRNMLDANFIENEPLWQGDDPVPNNRDITELAKACRDKAEKLQLIADRQVRK